MLNEKYWKRVKLHDKILNLFSFNPIKGYCKYCRRNIYKIKSKWGRRNICLFCYQAEERVREEYKVKMYF